MMPDHARRKQRLAVGLMSGTSLDAVDAALVAISGAGDKIRVCRVAFVTMPYPAAVRRRLLSVARGEPVAAGEISQLNFLLGALFADAAIAVCRRAQVKPEKLFVVGSHGQTIYHQGVTTTESGRRICSTLQIAEPAVIAERTRAPVVADFRAADLAADGQGAPLVPLVDYLLLRGPRESVVALNLGGIANVTVIPADASAGDVIGFDTGPGNMVMDGLVRRFTHGRRSYDPGGSWASRGKLLEDVLSKALSFPFFRLRPPKTAGREQFGDAFLQKYFLSRPATFHDLLCTANELTARTVVDAIRRRVRSKGSIGRIVVSGGGARNRYLIDRIASLSPETPLKLSDEFGFPSQEKEAIAFAILADRTMHGLSGNLPRVTGARRSVVLGKVVRS